MSFEFCFKRFLTIVTGPHFNLLLKGNTPASAQGLHLTLHSGIIHIRVLGIKWGFRDHTAVFSMHARQAPMIITAIINIASAKALWPLIMFLSCRNCITCFTCNAKRAAEKHAILHFCAYYLIPILSFTFSSTAQPLCF